MTRESHAPTHPLDPFTAAELTRAVELLRDSERVSKAVRFSAAFPVEPPKRVVDDFEAGADFKREVRLVGYDPERTGSFDAHISLDQGEVLTFQPIENGHAPLSMMDFIRVIQIVKEDAGLTVTTHGC